MELLLVREFADRGTKWLLESPENVLGLLQILDFDLSTKIDSSRLHDEKKSFILDNLRPEVLRLRLQSDLVFSAPFLEEYGKEGEVWLYILIEHQSEPDISMGFRMLFYMTQIWDTQRREWERNKAPKSQWNFRSRPFLRKPRVPHPTTQSCPFFFIRASHHGICLSA